MRSPIRQITPRYLTDAVSADLAGRMVFVGGPSQVGKTTFALSLLAEGSDESSPAHLNWDLLADREEILAARLPPRQDLIIFHEIHKYAAWRGLIKGLFDTHRSSISFLVTGSARLDYYPKGGDSLQGRYHYYRLHPFTLLESGQRPDAHSAAHLLRFGGFPEPLLRGEEHFHHRWRREHAARVVHEDLRDLEQVREVSRLDLLLTYLPSCVGSPLSVNRLRKLLQVSHESVERWISAFERLYVCYRLAPFGSAPIRAVRKERKLYFWDWSRVDDPGARFENMVAGHLLKYCHWIEDTEGHAPPPPVATFASAATFPASIKCTWAGPTLATRCRTRACCRSGRSAANWRCRSERRARSSSSGGDWGAPGCRCWGSAVPSPIRCRVRVYSPNTLGLLANRRKPCCVCRMIKRGRLGTGWPIGVPAWRWRRP